MQSFENHAERLRADPERAGAFERPVTQTPERLRGVCEQDFPRVSAAFVSHFETRAPGGAQNTLLERF